MALDQIAATLRTTVKNAPARIVRMKLGPVCSRCGGCGEYSFNQVDGSRCYGCNGAGSKMPRTAAEWQATADAAERVASDGTLDRYIAERAAQARSKNGLDRAFAAWKAMDALNGYGPNWLGISERAKTDPTAAKMIERNSVGVDLVDALQKLDKGRNTDWVEYDRVLSAGLARLTEIKTELEGARP